MRRKWFTAWLVAPLGLTVAFAAASVGASAQPPALPDSAGLFARMPDPGGPEGVAVADDGIVYVATLNGEGGDPSEPSKVFAFSPDGSLLRSYQIQGQDLSATDHGLTGITFDASGDLYVGDLAPPRVLRLDPRDGRQTTYATFREVPTCAGGGAPGDCKAGLRDFPSWPDYPVFTADGTMYISDSNQALIWRIPRGGGDGQVFFTDDRLQTLIGKPAFGPSGLTLTPDGQTLAFTTIEGPLGDGDITAGRIWKLPIRPDGRPGTLGEFWVSQSADAPDGLAFGQSGRLYVNLPGANQTAVVSPDGHEIARTPTPLNNQLQTVPYDDPLGLAFQNNRLLIANSAFLDGNPNSWALLTLDVREPGVPQIHPNLGSATTQPTSSPSRGGHSKSRTCAARHRSSHGRHHHHQQQCRRGSHRHKTPHRHRAQAP